MANKIASNPNLVTDYARPSGPMSFMSPNGSSVPVDVTQAGVSIGGAKPVPQTPNILPPVNSNIPPQETEATKTYNQQVQQSNAQNSPYRQAFQAAQAQGIQAPNQSGQGAAIVNRALQSVPSQVPQSTQNVDQFFATSPQVQQGSQDVMDFLSPINTQSMIFDQMNKIVD